MLGTVLFLIACLIKWQPLIVAPFIGVYLFEISNLRTCRRAVGRRLFWQLATLVAVTIALLSAPARSFWHGMNHPYLSGNALNLPWVGGFFYKLLFSSSSTRRAELTPTRRRLLSICCPLRLFSGLFSPRSLFVQCVPKKFSKLSLVFNSRLSDACDLERWCARESLVRCGRFIIHADVA